MPTKMPVRAVGLPWYKAEDYAAIRSVMKDGDRLPATHADWQRKAEHIEQKCRGDGYLTVRAYVDPVEFPLWCSQRGLDVDANARTQFASWVALQAHGKTH